MNKKIAIVLIFSGIILAAGNAQDATAFLKQAESIMYPDNFYLVNTLVTTSPVKSDTSMTFEIYHRKDAGTLMEITEPARSKGIRFLQKDNNLWMYNPKARSGNAIRLSARGAFQGSTFSNNDMSDPNYSDDYSVTIAGMETIAHPELGQIECIVIEGTAKTKDTTYSKIKMWLRKSDHMPLQMHYFAQSGVLYKVMKLSGFKQMAGRLRPTVVAMESLDMKGTVSTVTIQQMTVRNDLPAGKFTESALTR
ncbi:MAG: outer membrane lipoprotein-sorting protein [Spirochaetales bacterium]|nr:outer membrane lipoprotein-sorting protein [Spirochaetales bacterium]